MVIDWDFFPLALFAAVSPHHNPIGPRKKVVTGAVPGLNTGDHSAFTLIHESSVCIVGIVGLSRNPEDDQLLITGFDGSILG